LEFSPLLRALLLTLHPLRQLDRYRKEKPAAFADFALHPNIPAVHLDKRLDDAKIDVRFEQRQANFTQGRVDVLFRQDAFATQVLEQTGVPSASVAIVKGGKLVYAHAYGKARLDPATPATPEMRYSLGSISKQFTAAAILLLQEQGKLSIDDAVGKYLPGLTRGDEVTIRQILSHTSGYQDYWPEDYVMTPMLRPETAQQILDTWAKKPLDFEPGTQWQYSNTNFVIAGAIIENVSGQKLMDFLQQRIFHPLGMKSAWNSDEAKLTQADATPYYRNALGPLRPAPKEGRGWTFAMGELAMTAHDLALWDDVLHRQQAPEVEGRYLRRRTAHR